jgi:aminoglycoside phosphotransferase (APT) family kinase protein
VQLSASQLIGSGLTSDVYSWGPDRVLKLFRPGVDRAIAQRELDVSRAVHAMGVPAPAAHDLIEVDGRPGIVFDRLVGPSLVDYVESRPWALFEAARMLADLHAQLHAREAPPELPALEGHPSAKALCHGDFHPGNIILTSAGPVIIDWETAHRGHPLADVARTSRLFQHASLPDTTSRFVRVLFAASRGLLHASYLRRYLRLRPGTREEIRAWERALPSAK